MIKKRTQFVLIVGIGLSLFSGFSQTALTTMDSVDSPMIVSARYPDRLGPITVLHNYDDGFSVLSKGTKHVVENHLVGIELRTIAESHTLEAFLKSGYISVNRGSDNKYSLKAIGRLMGGVGERENTETSAVMDDLGRKAAEMAIICATSKACSIAYDKLFRTQTITEKNEENHQKHKLALSTCLLANTDERTTKIPSVCRVIWHDFKMVSTAAQVSDVLMHFKEETT